jgi:hypothetical protein
MEAMYILYTVHSVRYCKYVYKPAECLCIYKYAQPTKTMNFDNGQTRIPIREGARRLIQYTDQNLVMNPRYQGGQTSLHL